MKVAMEIGDQLEVAIVSGGQIVGSLAIQLNSVVGAKASKPGRPAKAAAEAAPAKRKGRRKLSPEAKARMSDAQKARWAKKREAKPE